MTEKIFRAIMASAAGVLLACTFIILGCLYEHFGSLQTAQLWAELDMAAVGVESSGADYLSALASDSSRLTWIAADGTVLYDAQADEYAMENHAQREEVQEALTSGTGSSQRYSKTLLEKTIYCAKRLSDGSVLRISISRATMAVLAVSILQPICVLLLAVLIAALWLANSLSKRIVEPLNSLDLDHPLENKTYDELAPLLTRISQQRCQIDEQLQLLQQKNAEFGQITGSMNEGLVLLDNRGFVLSMNPAAQGLFQAGQEALGQDFLTVERSPELCAAISRAQQEGRGEALLERGGKMYQIDLSAIVSEGDRLGMVLLSFDVTAKMDAERTRREFTANVSHELKTPLTAILGSSELLQAGMIRPEDIPRFAGHIHSEAARLLTLIEDIIRLSQLDEGTSLPQETIDLADTAADVLAQLQGKADQCHVTLQLQAEPCPLVGTPSLFYEIVYNLTENAIKYNVDGGSVTVSVTANGVLTVADTGIGIPPEQQDRVFERFYRVDKSHSKAIGGTGLGLSIVKHAAAVLHAAIELQSTVNQGTTVRVTFSCG